MKLQRKCIEPMVAISGNSENEGINIEDSLNLLPIDGIICKDDVVVINPNWVKTEPPSQGTVVGNESLKSLINYIKQNNPKRIVIAAGAGSTQTNEVMKYNGYDKVLEATGAEFIDLNYGPYTKIQINNTKPATLEINKLFNEMTVYISYTQLKHHREATASMCIKNMALSWPPAELHGYPKYQQGIHNSLHEFIAAMGEKLPIDISILSADKSMIGTGPSGGKPVACNMVIAGTDPVSVDTVGARLLGYLPQSIYYLYLLMKRKVGEADLRKVQLLGMSLKDAETRFSNSAYGFPIILDEKEVMSIDHMI